MNSHDHLHRNDNLSNAELYPSPTVSYDEVAQSSDLFWQSLKAFHNCFGTKFSIPTVGGKDLDLHRLFIEVTTRGGFGKVIRDRKWKEMVVVFNFPTTITSGSFVLRKYYQSLLYHFEQVYYFRKQVPSMSTDDLARANMVDDSRNPDEGSAGSQVPGQGSVELKAGSWFSGAIDGKFESGYLISVSTGGEKLQGVLYHVPNQKKSHCNRKKSRLGEKDPSRPKSNRSGYNFFFAEHYANLKPLYHGQEKAISKRIGLLWNNLSEPERQVYQEKGVIDKERYRNEMSEYKSSYNPEPHP